MTTPEPIEREATTSESTMVDPQRVIEAAGSEFEEGMRTGLPTLKAGAQRTAADIGAAGRPYRDQRRDDPAAAQWIAGVHDALRDIRF